MARLLILLACARVAAGVMDALDIKAVCEVPTDGGPRKIYLDMTFTFPPDATDGTMSACVVTNGAGSDGECSAGGQACSRAIQYHEFLPGQTSRHVHEYCACN